MSRTVRVAVVIASLTVGLSAAQTPTPAPEEPVQVPAGLSSPRATMETFLGAFYDDEGVQWDRALSALDMSALPPEARVVKGRELASRLKRVIDRIEYVDLQTVHDDPRGSPYTFATLPEGRIVIAPGPDGVWRFTAETLRDLDAVWRAVRERDTVAGVEEAPETVSPATWVRRRVPASLRAEVLFLETWQWLGLLLVIVAGWVVDRVVTTMLGSTVQKVLQRRGRVVDHALLLRALRPLGMLVMLVVWGVGVLWIGLPLAILEIYLDGVRIAAIVAAVLTAYRIVDVLSELLERRAARTASRFDDLLVPLVRKSLKTFIVAVGVVLVAQNLDINVAGLVAGLGLGGLAFALAAKDTVSNLFGSLTVLLDRPFQVGDWIVVGDVEGTVEELGFRSTRIRTFYNSLVTLPNANLISAAVDNLGQRAYRRWSTTLSITYDTPPEKIDAFCEGVRELVRRHPYTRKDYFHVYFNEFGAASLNVLLYVFFHTPDWATELRERHRLGVDVVRLAHELGIEFAFPTQTLYLRQEGWEAPERAGESYPERRRELEEGARSRAGRLVGNALGGAVPGPVTFDEPPHVEGGDA